MARRSTRLVFIAMRISPALTGGEKYNSHLIAAMDRVRGSVIMEDVSSNAIYRRISDLRFFWRLCRPFAWLWMHWKIIQYRHDCLMFDGWLAPLLWPGIYLIRGHYMVMVHHLSADFYRQQWRRTWEVFCERALLSGAKRVLTVSRSSRERIEARVGRTMEEIDIINPAFEPHGGVSSGGDGVLRILFVGHMTRVKGILELVQAAMLLPRDIGWHLDLVGDHLKEPTTPQQIAAWVGDAKLDDRITVHGRLDDQALLNLYLTSDIFVLPSYWEGYGIVLLEAMSHKLAVISTAVGAIPEVVTDGVNGVLVPPRDVDALYRAMLQLLKNPSLREDLAQQGLQFASQHPDWNGMEAQCACWYKQIASDL
ncbi:MAG: glycosyltransferase family 4 protein [Mariprofundales bacterium]